MHGKVVVVVVQCTCAHGEMGMVLGSTMYLCAWIDRYGGSTVYLCAW